MSATATINITQNFLSELGKVSGKASFTPFEKIAESLKYLEESGIPNAKHEEYKYCNMELLLRKEFKSLQASATPINPELVKKIKSNPDAVYIFIVNGKISKELSDLDKLPKGILIESIDLAAEKFKAHFHKHFFSAVGVNTDAFLALNTAFAADGIFLHASKNTVAENPIHIVYTHSNTETTAFQYRKLFLIEPHANITLHEHYTEGSGKHFVNDVTEIVVEENAKLNHTLIQHSGNNFYGVNSICALQQSNSHYAVNTFVFSGALIRNNLQIKVNGQNAETHLNGLCIGREQMLIDNHTTVDHTLPNCESNELYKGIAGGKSNLVFNGKIFVRRDAQKINAYQSSKNILLSDDATVNTKPQLEIFADDVKCSHGTSTGKVDEEALFYLKSRCIGEDSARILLLNAFAGEVTDKVDDEHLRGEIEAMMEHALIN